MAENRKAPDIGQGIAVGALGGLLGNLLTAAVLYLALVAGRVIPASVPLIILSVSSVVVVSSGVLWAVGTFSNRYTQASVGKKGVTIGCTCVIGIALIVLLVLAARSRVQ